MCATVWRTRAMLPESDDDGSMMPTNSYRCKHCKKIVKRKSSKAWIKSYCDKTGRFVHLMLIPKKRKTQGA